MPGYVAFRIDRDEKAFTRSHRCHRAQHFRISNARRRRLTMVEAEEDHGRATLQALFGTVWPL